jgi:hypothetical protein
MEFLSSGRCATVSRGERERMGGSGPLLTGLFVRRQQPYPEIPSVEYRLARVRPYAAGRLVPLTPCVPARHVRSIPCVLARSGRRSLGRSPTEAPMIGFATPAYAPFAKGRPSGDRGSPVQPTPLWRRVVLRVPFVQLQTRLFHSGPGRRDRCGGVRTPAMRTASGLGQPRTF